MEKEIQKAWGLVEEERKEGDEDREEPGGILSGLRMDEEKGDEGDEQDVSED